MADVFLVVLDVKVDDAFQAGDCEPVLEAVEREERAVLRFAAVARATAPPTHALPEETRFAFDSDTLGADAVDTIHRELGPAMGTQLVP